MYVCTLYINEYHTLYASGDNTPNKEQGKETLLPKYIYRVSHDRIYTPYMTLYLVISLPKIPYVHCIYMALANPIQTAKARSFGSKF
jgi:hypothetical protein